MQPHVNSMTFRVLLIEEDDGWWSAQCLEHDIAAQAKRLADLRYELERVLMAHIMLCEHERIEPFSNIAPAPKEYWDMYEKADISVLAKEVHIEASPAVQHALPKQQFRVAEHALA